MSKVYANAVVSISTCHAEDGNGGLYSDRDANCFFSATITLQDGSDHGSWLIWNEHFNSDVAGAPLNHRSWVLQERVLARRGLHFGRSQEHWDCTSLVTSESVPSDFDTGQGHIQRLKKVLSSAGTTQQSVADGTTLWKHLSVLYSCCSITFPGDKATAIAGIAQVLCYRLGYRDSDYLCGIRRSTFIHGPMWRRVDMVLPPRPSDRYNLPSWSWLLETQGTYLSARWHWKSTPSGGRLKRAAQLLHAQVSIAGPNKFGKVLAASATIQGPLCRVKLGGYYEDDMAMKSGDASSLTLGALELTCEDYKMLLDNAGDFSRRPMFLQSSTKPLTRTRCTPLPSSDPSDTV